MRPRQKRYSVGYLHKLKLKGIRNIKFLILKQRQGYLKKFERVGIKNYRKFYYILFDFGCQSPSYKEWGIYVIVWKIDIEISKVLYVLGYDFYVLGNSKT